MYFFEDPQFGNRMITLMAAFVLVLQIAMVGQRWLVTNIRVFAAQSFLLAGIANTIAYFNHAPHIYIAAFRTFRQKAVALPIVLERLVKRIDIGQEIAPLVNVPLSLLISGGLTTVGYVVAASYPTVVNPPEISNERGTFTSGAISCPMSILFTKRSSKIGRATAFTVKVRNAAI